MTDEADDPKPPIEVPTKALPGVTQQTLQLTIVGLCAMGVDHFVKHDMLIPAVMAGATALATWLVGMLQHIHTISLFKSINELVSDRLVKAKQ